MNTVLPGQKILRRSIKSLGLLQGAMADLQRPALKLCDTHAYSVGDMSTEALYANIFQSLLRVMRADKLIGRLFIEGKPSVLIQLRLGLQGTR